MSGEGIISEEDRAQAAEYVLSLLDPPIEAAFEARLSEEPALRAQVVDWTEDFVTLTDGIPEVAPPGAIWPRIQAQLFGVEERPSFWQRIGLAPALFGALALAAAAFVVVRTDLLQPQAQPEFRAEVAAEDASVRFRAEYDADTGGLHLVREAGTAAPGRSFELWLIAGGNAPVSVMVWPNEAQEERILLSAPLAASLPGAVLAISDEPEGGSPTGAPTGAVLATGEVQPI